MSARRVLPIGAALVALAFAFGTVSESNGYGHGFRTSAATAAPISLRANPAIGPFQGLGVWVDIYDAVAWQRPGASVRSMAAHGVKTLYLETSNYRNHSAFVHKTRTIDFIDAAHRFGVNIVAWYLPAFRDTTQDVRRVRAAIRLVTPKGSTHGTTRDVVTAIPRVIATATSPVVMTVEELTKRYGAFMT